MLSNSGPLVSIVTPSLNQGRFIEATLRSVQNQTYANIEHIVVDGGSTDKTIEVLKQYESTYNLRWISEKDDGLYHAVAKGLEMASGQVLGWLNSSDMYLPWAAALAVEYICDHDVGWLTGIPAIWDEEGHLLYVSPLKPSYRQQWIRRGWYHGNIFGWIQQESVFFSRSLWVRSRGFPEDITWAGDYWLWRDFARHEDLVTVPTVISGSRMHPDQASQKHKTEYLEEAAPDWPRTGKLLKGLGAGYFYDIWKLISTKSAPMRSEE